MPPNRCDWKSPYWIKWETNKKTKDIPKRTGKSAKESRLKKAEARLNRKRKKMLRHQKLLSGELYTKYLTEQ